MVGETKVTFMATKRVLPKRHESVVKVAARARNNPTEVTSRVRSTGISLPEDVYDLLVDLAFKRKKSRARGASVSGIVLECVVAMRDQLEAERRA
jgi:hypothetical protein